MFDNVNLLGDVATTVADLVRSEKERCVGDKGVFLLEKSQYEYIKYKGNNEILFVDTIENADYARILVSLGETGEKKYLLFSRVDDGDFKGVAVGNESYINTRITRSVDHVFKNEELLQQIYDMLLDKEEWNFEGGLDVLESYLHRVLSISKIKHLEGKEVFQFNASGNKILMNTNLIDVYGDYIKIMLNFQENQRDSKDIKIINPVLVYNPAYILYHGFKIDQYEMQGTQFYSHPTDLVFRGEVADFLLDNHNKYSHLMERVHRLPVEYRKITPLEMANRVKSSIELAVRMSKIDYKYIIPCYSVSDRRICFLIPMTGNIGNSTETIAYLLITKKASRWEVVTLFDKHLAFIAARTIAPRPEIMGQTARLFITPKTEN